MARLSKLSKPDSSPRTIASMTLDDRGSPRHAPRTISWRSVPQSHPKDFATR
jgi:hypothetical protein